MSDLEAEQEKSSSLAAALQAQQQVATEATDARQVADARVRTLQVQVARANDVTAAMTAQVQELQALTQVGAHCARVHACMRA